MMCGAEMTRGSRRNSKIGAGGLARTVAPLGPECIGVRHERLGRPAAVAGRSGARGVGDARQAATAFERRRASQIVSETATSRAFNQGEFPYQTPIGVSAVLPSEFTLRTGGALFSRETGLRRRPRENTQEGLAWAALSRTKSGGMEKAACRKSTGLSGSYRGVPTAENIMISTA